MINIKKSLNEFCAYFYIIHPMILPPVIVTAIGELAMEAVPSIILGALALAFVGGFITAAFAVYRTKTDDYNKKILTIGEIISILAGMIILYTFG